MARTKISEFSATAADNTDIDNINIAEGCAPSGINNAIRELMAQLKDMQTGASGDTFTLTTVNSTTVDTTNLEATNLKAKDGTAAGSIADSTGVVTLASTVLTTTDINGGTVDGTTIGATTPSTVVATQVDITAQGDLRLQDTTGGQFVALQAPGTIATSYTLTLPVDDGTSGQALITDGSGVLSWSTAASGDVYGPASATDNAIARYDGTTGKIIQNSAVTIADDGATVIAANSTTDGLRITQIGTGNALLVEDSANPDATPFVIDAIGAVRVGYLTASTTLSNDAAQSVTPQFQVLGAGLSSAAAAISSWSSTASVAPTFALLKSKSGTIGTNGIVASADVLGRFDFVGDDGASFITGASITAAVDGTPGTNDMPGRLVFSTTADGASSPTERMRIDNQGRVGIGGTPGAQNRVRLVGSSTGNTTQFGFLNELATASDVTGSSAGFTTSLSTAAAAFTLSELRHFSASFTTIGAGSAITSQTGFYASSGLTGATNNYGFYSTIASGTGRWNFYAAGTANNYFAGNTGIGDTSPTPVYGYSTVLSVSGNYAAVQFNSASSATLKKFQIGVGNDSFQFYDGTVGAERGRISNTGVWSLGGLVGSESLRVTPVASAVNYLNVYGGATGNSALMDTAGSDTNVSLQIRTKGTGDFFFFTGSYIQPQFRIAHTASAVNYLQVTGAASEFPALSAQGSSTNISVVIKSKGIGAVYSQTGGGTQFIVDNTASAVNWLQVTGAATGVAPVVSARGSDTNIDLALTPKGTGVLRFGTHTVGILAQSGYITIKDAAGNTRNLLVG